MKFPRRSILLLALGMTGLLAVSASHAQVSVARTTSFEYDPATGLLVKETVEPGKQQFQLVTSYTYDDFGNRKAVTISSPATGIVAIAERSASTTYDARGQFPLQSTNAMGHAESKTFDSKYGTLTSATDPNGLKTTWQYDTLGRKTLEIRPDGNRTRWDYLFCNGVNGGTTACPTLAKYMVQISQRTSAGVANGPWVKMYFDALNREIRSETQGFDGTSVIVKLTEYDALGRVYRTSAPHYSSEAPQWTEMRYDALGRIYATIQPNNATTTVQYDGLTTRTTNALSQTQTTVKNAVGEVIQVVDAAGASILYEYDPFGNLTKTTDPNGNVFTMAYDIRGRKYQMVDPDMGTWEYDYNPLGELVKQVDGRGRVANIYYDKLGRMKSRNERDLISTWTYDYCVNGIGKTCSAASSNDFSAVTSYDTLGRPTSTSTTMDAGYTSSVTYDANGRMATQSYPTGLTVKYVYTNLGYLKEVRNNATDALYWRADKQNAAGHLLQQTYGNNIVTTQVFDVRTGRTKNINAGTNNGVQNLAYAFDDLGNLLSRTDVNQNLAETFLYDNRNRLKSSTVNSGIGTVTQSYNYDAIGNITSRSGVGTYTYGAVNAKPHAVAEVALIGGGKRVYQYDGNGNLLTEVQYDAAGNVVAGKGRTMAYNSFNMPQSITTGSQTLSFTYGPAHQRVRQVAPTATTIYLHPDNAGGLFYEKDIKAGGVVEHKHFISANGQVIALVKQTAAVTKVLYFHRDYLGSVTALTDEAGSVVERLAYEPFGKRRFANGAVDANGTIVGVNTDRGYTDHEHLDEVGLVHMNGRIYDPVLGRFLSADPFIQSPYNLQSYNRYAYVMNNPFMYTDPSGYFSLSKFFKKIVRPVIAIAAIYVLGPGGYYGVAGVTGNAFASAMIAGAAAGAVNTGDLRGALQGAFTAGLFYGAGSLSGSMGWAEGSIARGLTHAAAGCVSASAAGGNCSQGAVSAGFAEVIGGNVEFKEMEANLVARTVIGGTSSVLGGGKFSNGAMTGAFGYLFNKCGHSDCWKQSAFANSGSPGANMTSGENFVSLDEVNRSNWQMLEGGLVKGTLDGATAITTGFTVREFFVNIKAFFTGFGETVIGPLSSTGNFSRATGIPRLQTSAYSDCVQGCFNLGLQLGSKPVTILGEYTSSTTAAELAAAQRGGRAIIDLRP